MLFNSFEFVGFVLVVLLLYYLPVFSRFQIEILIVSSLVFYACNRPVLVFLLLLSATINIVASYYIVHGSLKYKKIVADQD